MKHPPRLVLIVLVAGLAVLSASLATRSQGSQQKTASIECKDATVCESVENGVTVHRLVIKPGSNGFLVYCAQHMNQAVDYVRANPGLDCLKIDEATARRSGS
jgi:hypothetical protein